MSYKIKMDSIFETFIDKIPFSQIFSEIAPIALPVIYDGLSSKICGSCKEKVINCYKFQQSVLASDKQMRQKIVNVIKEEDERSLSDGDEHNYNEIQDDDWNANLPMSPKVELEQEPPKKKKLQETSRRKSKSSSVKKSAPKKSSLKESVSNNGIKVEPENTDQEVVQNVKEEPLISRSKIYSCDLCPYKHRLKNYITAHVIVHRTGEGRRSCKICAKVFSREVLFVKHQVEHTPAFEKSRVVVNGLPLDCKCFICLKEFANSHLAAAHLQSHYKETKFSCNTCSKEFNKYIEMYKHFFSHKENHRYKCSICFKSHRNRTSILKCLNIHTDVKPHQCHFCDLKFYLKCRLEEHIRLHEDLKPFLCTHCGMRFRVQAVMTTHIKRVHLKIKRHTCPVCSKTFVLKSK